MMKSGDFVVLVDSVEEAIKFYTEKLTFDIVDLQSNFQKKEELTFVRFRKGKCFITFRKPYVEEFAEFSFIKRCASRCAGLSIEMKKGLGKLFERCKKKDITLLSDIKEEDNTQSFVVKDPFGIKLIFTQPKVDTINTPHFDFFGMQITHTSVKNLPDSESELLNRMINRLKPFGVLRRTAKKYSKQYLKELSKSISKPILKP